MSRRPYCERELPGFETLCQQCFEAGYDQIVHPKPWWQRLRLTRDSLYVFLFFYVYVYLCSRFDVNHRPTMTSLALLAFALAASAMLIARVMRDPGEPKVTRRSLYAFLILLAYFFFRLWVRTSYHPVKRPALFAFVLATIATLIGTSEEIPVEVQDHKKKAPEGPAPLRTSREMRSSEK